MIDLDENNDDNAIEDLGEEILKSFVEYVKRVSPWSDEIPELYKQGKVFPHIIYDNLFRKVNVVDVYNIAILNEDVQTWMDDNIEDSVYYLSDFDVCGIVPDPESYRPISFMILFFKCPIDLTGFKLRWC